MGGQGSEPVINSSRVTSTSCDGSAWSRNRRTDRRTWAIILIPGSARCMWLIHQSAACSHNFIVRFLHMSWILPYVVCCSVKIELKAKREWCDKSWTARVRFLHDQEYFSFPSQPYRLGGASSHVSKERQRPFPQEYSNFNVKLTTHYHLSPSEWRSGAAYPRCLCILQACFLDTGTNLAFTSWWTSECRLGLFG